MATPILLIKINPKTYTEDQFREIKERASMKCYDYHCFVIYSEQVKDISFEVHNSRNECLKVTSDLVATVSGKDIEAIVDRQNKSRS